MKILRKASSHGPRKWSESGSILGVKARIFKRTMLLIEEVKWITEAAAFQRGNHAPSRKAKQRNLAKMASKGGEGR